MCSSSVDPLALITRLEVKQLEMEDLKSEIGRLKNTILSKNRENAMLRTTLKSQQAKLSSLHSLSDSYSTQVRNILSPGQQPYGQIFTPSANEASGSGCDD